jgi:two-component system cell cycle sensor histidine kinase PleC
VHFVHFRASQSGKSLLSRYAADYGNLLSRRTSERALRAAALESAIACRAKSEFLANMSHELRTPLNAIIGFSDLLQHVDMTGKTAKMIEYAQLISQAGTHLLGIISDILDLSKIESGTFELDLQSNSIGEVVDASVAIIRPRLEAKNHECAVVVDGDIPSFAFDRRRVIQCVINLLANANKFTPDGGKILVTAGLHDDFVSLTVGDTGIGMTPDQVVEAFKPFGQLKTTYHRSGEGTGLGLPLTRALVDAHGGTLDVSSEPGVGTSVTFSLPRICPEISARGTFFPRACENIHHLERAE